MKVFITGATGYIGERVAGAVAAAGHDVTALAHHDDARAAFEAAGYEPLPGGLEDLDVLRAAASGADATIHLANTGGERAGEIDDAATRAMVDAIAGTGKGFLYTSGIWVLGPTGGTPAAEDAGVDPIDIVAWRGPLEAWLVAAAGRDVRTVVIRPGVVYGDGGGLPGMMARGELPVVGDGGNRWPVVHRDDLARLYVAALDRAPAGAILHAEAGTVRAGELGEALGADRVPIVAARKSMGGFADALALDQVLDSTRTRALLGWEPREEEILT